MEVLRRPGRRYRRFRYENRYDTPILNFRSRYFYYACQARATGCSAADDVGAG